MPFTATVAATSNSMSMFPLYIPPFLSGDITVSSVDEWISGCEGIFMTAELGQCHDPTLTSSMARMHIRTAGLLILSPDALRWWNDNQKTIRNLKSWDAFVALVREQLVPSYWKLTALANFYDIRQGFGDFTSFLNRLQAARDALASAGEGYAISDAIFKHHLLFHANRQLYLRVRDSLVPEWENIKIDALIERLSATWDLMALEKTGFDDQDKSVAAAMPIIRPFLLDLGTDCEGEDEV